ncbi:MAG: siphovirus Gp157 family protein, partial [Oscillospiraceae bacterium]|nr:siphovirus Gp157 family protein [Oscillospiraceae bacterium]
EKQAEAKVESLKKWLVFALEGEKFTTARVAISYRKSVSVQVDESLLDKKYMKEKVTYTPDKIALKKALQAGENIEGAYLEEKPNIQIK